jgi:plasmid stabilization system protein ParE
MIGYVVAPKADEDIFEIWQYLCQKAGVAVADRLEAEIYAAFGALIRNPATGHKRSDLTSHPVLFFAVHSYMIVYRTRTPLEIVRVLHAKQDIQQILAD